MRINRDVVTHAAIWLVGVVCVASFPFCSDMKVAESVDFQADALKMHIEILRQNGTTIDEALLEGKSLAERQDVVADAIRWARAMQRTQRRERDEEL